MNEACNLSIHLATEAGIIQQNTRGPPVVPSIMSHRPTSGSKDKPRLFFIFLFGLLQIPVADILPLTLSESQVSSYVGYQDG